MNDSAQHTRSATASANQLNARGRLQGSLLSHGAIYVGGMVAQRGLSVLLLPLLTRILGVDEYGIASVAAALAVVLGLVYGLGLNFAIIRLYYDDAPDGRAGWAALLRAQAGVALALALITYLTGPWWSSLLGSPGWSAAFQIAVLYAWLVAVQSTLQGILRAAQRPIAFVITTLLQIGVGAALGITLALRWGAAGYMAGLCVGSALAVALGVLLTYRRPRWSSRLLIAGIALSLPALLHQLGSWGIEASDRLLVAAYLGVSDVGRYQVAYVLGSAFTLLLVGVQSAWAPHYIGKLGTIARRNIPSHVVVPLSVVAGLATALLVLAAPYLLGVLVPSSFGGTELVTALVASATIARAAYFMGVVVLLDRRQSKHLAAASLIGLGTNIGLNLLLIPKLGLVGAGLATAVAVIVQTVLVLATAQWLLKTNMSIGPLCVLWVGGAGALACLAIIPLTALGMLVRIVIAVVIVICGWFAVRWLHARFQIAHRRPAPGSVARTAANA